MSRRVGRYQDSDFSAIFRVIGYHNQDIPFRQRGRRHWRSVKKTPVRAANALVNENRVSQCPYYLPLMLGQLIVAHQHMAVPARMAADYPGSKAVRRFEIAGHWLIIALPPGVVYRPGWAGRRRT